jgi:hypothetical protein
MARQKVVRRYGRYNATSGRNEWRRVGHNALDVTDTNETGLPAGVFYPNLTVYPGTTQLPTPPGAILPKMFGASAEFGLWEDTQAKLGSPGLTCRRVYAIMNATGTGKQADINEIIADGMTPIVSYKPPTLAGASGPDYAGVTAGTYDSWIVAAKDFLVSKNVPLTVSFWHEPHNEIPVADFIVASHKFLDVFEDARPQIKIGPILNGYLLDFPGDTPKFETYIPDDLLDRWDFVAADIYQNGTNAAPGTRMPSRLAGNLVNILTLHGYPHMPIGVGEFNALTAAGITDAGNTFLNTPTLWFALLWLGLSDSNGVDWQLDQAETDAYLAILADPRTKKI